MAEEKTNVMRLLEQKKIPCTLRAFDPGREAPDGVTAAEKIGVPAETCFKTLVTQGASGKNYVFVIPSTGELDLKAAAKAVGEKSIEMIRQAKLLPLTGYVHGGCSPIGMKKRLPTILDESARTLQEITISAGKIGRHVTLAPGDLAQMIQARFAPVSK